MSRLTIPEMVQMSCDDLIDGIMLHMYMSGEYDDRDEAFFKEERAKLDVFSKTSKGELVVRFMNGMNKLLNNE